MLSCEMCLERMSLALDAPLSLEDRRELEDHLVVCPECRAAYEALFQMEDALREIGETPAPAELSARVMEQIRAEEDRRPAPLRRRARWRGFAGLAACAVLCLGVWSGGAQLDRSGVVLEPAPALQSSEEGTAAAGPAQEQTAGGGEDVSAAESAEGGSGAAAQSPSPAEGRETEVRSLPAQAEVPAAFSGKTAAGSAQSEADSALDSWPETADGGEVSDQPQPAQEERGNGGAGQQPAQEAPDSPAVNAVTAAPPWGSGTALFLRALPEGVEALLPRDGWVQEEDGTRWCQTAAEEMEALQAALAQAGVETDLPEKPWTEPCALVLLPVETSSAELEQLPS